MMIRRLVWGSCGSSGGRGEGGKGGRESGEGWGRGGKGEEGDTLIVKHIPATLIVMAKVSTLHFRNIRSLMGACSSND